MGDLRKSLGEEITCVESREVYAQVYRVYVRAMTAKIVLILLIAVVGLVSIIDNAVEPSRANQLMCIICYISLFLQLFTLPNGIVTDAHGNRFDLNSGKFYPNTIGTK